MDKKWWKEAVVYQIYPRSFKDTDGDGTGDIRGITEKADYIKNLGADVVWISPFFDSPLDDNGYDIRNYRMVAQDLGTEEDMEELFRVFHENGIKILIDLVVNHTSDEHPWFIKSRNGEGKYRDYYIWKKGNKDVPGGYPNNWESVFSGSAWKYDEKRGEYYLHVFSEKQPDLNWGNEEVRKEVYEIMEYWIKKGCDGFRMDVINLISKHFSEDDITEDYFFNGPKVHEYLREMNERVLKGRNLMTVGECPGATPEYAILYAGNDGRELNMIFTFEHMDVDSGNGKWDFKKPQLKELKKILSKWQTELHGRAWNSLYLNNHDQPRMVSRFGDTEKYHRESAKMLAHMIHTMEGTPYVYQGEELGMTNISLTIPDELRDLESINALKDLTEKGIFSREHMEEAIALKARDNARTPMQWNKYLNAGFSEGTPWMKVNPNYTYINAEDEQKDPDSILNFYRKLIVLRKNNEVLIYGDFTEYFSDSDKLYVYRRKMRNTYALSVNSFSGENEELNLTGIIPENAEVLISNYPGVIKEDSRITLKPWQCITFIWEEDNAHKE